MNRVVVGVIGHVDHGKTALARALTGVETDRLPEEQVRGISIALGFAHFKTVSGSEIDLIDMPGHERFVRTMVSGATGIDAVLLVVAANEGIKPQTVEHVDIVALLGIRRAVVAITKTDLVTSDQAKRVVDDAVRLLVAAGFDPPHAVMTSALRCAGITDLVQILDGLAAHTATRADDGVTFLPIDRAFSIVGHGPVITGTFRGSAIKAGDTLELLPSRRPVRVRSVQVHGEHVAEALPGQRVALNLRNVEITDLARGMALATPETLQSVDWLTLSIRAVDSAPPLKNGMRLRALLGTDEVDVRLRLLGRDVLEPGTQGYAQLRMIRPVAIPVGEHVILRRISPAQTVAGGKLLVADMRRLKRNAPRVLARLEEYSLFSPAERVTTEIARMGPDGTTIEHLARVSGLADWRITEILAPLPVVVTRVGLVMRKADLVRRKALLTPRPDPMREQADAARTAEIAAQLRQSALSPPTPAELLIYPQAQRAIDRLLRDGTVIRAVDRAKGKAILFHREAIDAAMRQLDPLLRDGEGLLVSEIAAALGISRKYCMPLLDHLDTIRFTERAGDRRVRGRAPSSGR